MKLGVNVDHIATLRQARGTLYPDPAVGALLAEHAGCDSIVAHLREDRRHINERDIYLIKKALNIPLNLEMSVNRDIVAFAEKIKPYQATLVPEKRRELTTEGGLDLIKNHKKISLAVRKLKKAGIKVSLFIDPVRSQIKAAKDMGVGIIEINTGRFCEAKNKSDSRSQVKKVKEAAVFAGKNDFFVAAGHGLDYANISPIAEIKEIQEFNIGHSIICRAAFTGLVLAVEEMIKLIKKK